MEEIKNPPEARLARLAEAPAERARGGKNILKRFFSLLKRHEFHFFVLFAYLLILSWPFLAYLNNKSVSFSFVYYFAAWIVLVVFLLVANAIEGEEGIFKKTGRRTSLDGQGTDKIAQREKH